MTPVPVYAELIKAYRAQGGAMSMRGGGGASNSISTRGIPCERENSTLLPAGLRMTGVVERYQAMSAAFYAKFGQDPELFTRAPGRVNLIGEHIDYEGYGVLPMAIKQDTIVAIAKGGTTLHIANLQQELYHDKEFSTEPPAEVTFESHSWSNYFVCAYKGVFEMLSDKGLPTPEPCGLQVMIHGIVPLGSGLSSSAAFMCSCFLAILSVHNISATQEQVAEYAARAERYVGVNCGGMDQAISMMGMQGVAKMVDFNPVRAQDVLLPTGATFVIGNSLAVSKKAVGAHKRYNLRVVECRLAAAMLAHELGMPQDLCKSVQTLMQLESVVADKTGGTGLAACADAVDKYLTKDIYTHEEIEEALGASPEHLYENDAMASKAVVGAREEGGFKLRQRARHVFVEAQRVRDFKAVCDSSIEDEDKLAQLGALMDASHASCAELYECSCPELDELVSKSKAAGALGARLTGAGWGGCTVSLVRDTEVDAFLEAVHKSYYAGRIAEGMIKEEDMCNVLFSSKPSSGAAVLRLGTFEA